MEGERDIEARVADVIEAQKRMLGVRAADPAERYLSTVYTRAKEVIGSDDTVMRWLGTPVAGLNYATPISLLTTEEGQNAVLDVLGRIEHGVF
jgi:putative toxin-antitoxin system antitoxin component (TIGR02293 family)